MKDNHKIAFFCAETTVYNYIEELSPPKKWFKVNVDEILRVYADSHSITKEELFFGMRNGLRPELKCLLLLRQSSER